MNSLVKQFNFGSEGQGLNVYVWKCRKCVLAKELGQLLDYADKRLPTSVRNNWANEFIEGKDYDVLTGNDLAEFKKMVSTEDTILKGVSSEDTRLKGINQLMVIYETGIHKVLLKTEKPIGVEIRNKLGEEVMPQLVRDEHYSPDRYVTDEGEMVGEINHSGSSLVDKLKFMQESGMYSNDTLKLLIADILEKETGLALPYLRPEKLEYYTIPELAEKSGRSYDSIMQELEERNIKGYIPGICRPSTNKDSYHQQMYHTLYSSKLLEVIISDNNSKGV